MAGTSMNLNLLLLGLPSSGKSALLGALQQVAQSKSTELNAELVDLSGELSKLKSSSDDAYKPTRDDIATYPVQVHSSDGEHSVTLVDTSGAKRALCWPMGSYWIRRILFPRP